jgi:hypothetical protein
MAVVAAGAGAGRARAPRTRRRRRRRRRLSCWPPCRSRPLPPRAARPPCVTPERRHPRRVAPHTHHTGWDLPRFWAAHDAPRPRRSAARQRPGPSTTQTAAAPPAGSCGHPPTQAGGRRQLCGTPVTSKASGGGAGAGLGGEGVVRVRVRVEIIGPGTYENVGQSQPARIMNDPTVSPRARARGNGGVAAVRQGRLGALAPHHPAPRLRDVVAVKRCPRPAHTAAQPHSRASTAVSRY